MFISMVWFSENRATTAIDSTCRDWSACYNMMKKFSDFKPLLRYFDTYAVYEFNKKGGGNQGSCEENCVLYHVFVLL